MADENHDATPGEVNPPKTDVSVTAPLPQDPGSGVLHAAAEMKPQDTAPSVPLIAVTPVEATPVAAAAPTPKKPIVSAPEPGVKSDIQNDMERILHGIKLPERRPPGTPAPPETKTFDTTLGASVEHANISTAREAAAKRPADEHMSAVHTLKDDLQHVVQDQKMSVVRAAALEQEKRRPEPFDTEPVGKRGPAIAIVIAIVLLFVVIGAGVGGAVYYFSQAQSAPQATRFPDALVFAEKTQPLPLDKQPPSALKQQLEHLRQSGAGTLGSMVRILPLFSTPATETTAKADRPATFREFMHALNARPSEELLRALSDQFFAGVHTVDENAPFIVVPVVSYDHAFKGMLEWEGDINADLAPFFTPVPIFMTSAEGTVQTRTFSDIVMKNYDVRALKDDTGTTQLYYSFPTRTTLIIAENPYSFPEILNRLQAERRL